MINPLVYNDHKDQMPKDCLFKISPSKFSQFVQYPHNWYRTEVLNEEGFTYSTSSVLGTIVHYCAEQVIKGKDVDKKVIEEYIDLHEPNDNYDPEVIRSQYREMGETLVNDYVLGRQFLEAEKFITAPIKDGFYIGGQLDLLEGTKDDCMISDYKTYHSKTKPRAIPAHYKYQLLTLASLWKRNGYNPTRIRLIYINRAIEGEISEKTGKRLKSYPPEVTVLTETITPEDYIFINSLLELCVDSCIATKEHPELTHVIWHDLRLRVS